jgi:hypothetical protein
VRVHHQHGKHESAPCMEKKGHNRQLCQVRMKTLGQSQVSLMEYVIQP